MLVCLLVHDQGRAQGDPPEWFSCTDRADCVWIRGDGGWPVAVRREHRQALLDRVARDAPHTTYFTLADCLPSTTERDAYLERSRSAVRCKDDRCRVTETPACR